MKATKIDLPLNGTRITTLDQLEENLTPEILQHVRSGKLAKWLRGRSLDEQANALDALWAAEEAAEFERHVRLFKSVCELFVSELDEAEARAAIQAEWDGQNAGIKKLLPLQQSGAEELAQETTLPEPDEETLAADNPPPKEYFINQLLLSQLAEQSNFYVTDNIPEDKLREVIYGYLPNNYGSNAQDDYGYGYASTFGYGGIEQAIVLLTEYIDNTWGSFIYGRGVVITGLLLTNRHLYGNDSETGIRKFAIKLEDINKIELSKTVANYQQQLVQKESMAGLFMIFGKGVEATYDYTISINDTVFWVQKKTEESSIEIFVDFLKDYLGIE